MSNPTPSGSEIPHSALRTPDSSALPIHTFKFEGRTYRLYKREASKDAPWQFRIQLNGQRRPRSIETNIASIAEKKACAMITASKSERWEEFLDKTALRKQCVITLADIFKHYRAYPNRKPSKTTRELNIHAIMDLVHVKHPAAAAENIPVTVLDADLVWDWKRKILGTASAESEKADASAGRHRQVLRSANSRLTQARSLFTNDLQSYYKRHGKLTLPKQIADFLKEPKFPADETGRTDYWPVPDTTIAKTFKALEELVSDSALRTPHSELISPLITEQNLNPYKVIWLTLGFGLRKSEIAAAKNNWFQNINGILYCAGDELAKNDKFPRVRAQLGVWDKLSKYIQDADPDAYVLKGTDDERTNQVFRRCSLWMENLGWNTQKKIHEFRSYAGCQIAMGDGTRAVDYRAAQEFLRHANITTTENFYRRYVRSRLDEVKLKLPVATPFIPKIVNG